MKIILVVSLFLNLILLIKCFWTDDITIKEWTQGDTKCYIAYYSDSRAADITCLKK